MKARNTGLSLISGLALMALVATSAAVVIQRSTSSKKMQTRIDALARFESFAGQVDQALDNDLLCNLNVDNFKNGFSISEGSDNEISLFYPDREAKISASSDTIAATGMLLDWVKVDSLNFKVMKKEDSSVTVAPVLKGSLDGEATGTHSVQLVKRKFEFDKGDNKLTKCTGRAADAGTQNIKIECISGYVEYDTSSKVFSKLLVKKPDGSLPGTKNWDSYFVQAITTPSYTAPYINLANYKAQHPQSNRPSVTTTTLATWGLSCKPGWVNTNCGFSNSTTIKQSHYKFKGNNNSDDQRIVANVGDSQYSTNVVKAYNGCYAGELEKYSFNQEFEVRVFATCCRLPNGS